LRLDIFFRAKRGLDAVARARCGSDKAQARRQYISERLGRGLVVAELDPLRNDGGSGGILVDETGLLDATGT